MDRERPSHLRERGESGPRVGRGNPSLVLPIALPDNAGACTLVKFPRSFTYLRPGEVRGRSSRADTPQRCFDKPAGQPHLAEMVSPETGHTAGVVQKSVPIWGTGVSLNQGLEQLTKTEHAGLLPVTDHSRLTV